MIIKLKHHHKTRLFDFTRTISCICIVWKMFILTILATHFHHLHHFICSNRKKFYFRWWKTWTKTKGKLYKVLKIWSHLIKKYWLSKWRALLWLPLAWLFIWRDTVFFTVCSSFRWMPLSNHILIFSNMLPIEGIFPAYSWCPTCSKKRKLWWNLKRKRFC